MTTAVAVLEFAAAVVFVLLLVRVAYILSSNPIGELTPELLYLRVGDLRAPAVFLLAVLLLESGEFMLPFLVNRGWVQAGTVDVIMFYVNAVQALFVLLTVLLVLLVVARYTHRGFDRRIRQSMETIAYLAGQRRRRTRTTREEQIISEAAKRRRGYE